MHDECMSRSESHERAGSGPPLFFFLGWGGIPEGAPPASHFFFNYARGGSTKRYEWSKLSLACTGKLVVRTGIKEVAGQTCALLDYGEESCRMDSGTRHRPTRLSRSVSCAAILL